MAGARVKLSHPLLPASSTGASRLRSRLHNGVSGAPEPTSESTPGQRAGEDAGIDPLPIFAALV
jgi:hypothetical protein